MNAQTPAITYEAVQERPRYWDGLSPARRQTLYGCAGEALRMSYIRAARVHATLAEAERYARRILGQRPGVPVEIYRRTCSATRDRSVTAIDRVAIVQRDALGRTWTDIQLMEPLL